MGRFEKDPMDERALVKALLGEDAQQAATAEVEKALALNSRYGGEGRPVDVAERVVRQALVAVLGAPKLDAIAAELAAAEEEDDADDE